jgi:hypothetical protein
VGKTIRRAKSVAVGLLRELTAAGMVVSGPDESFNGRVRYWHVDHAHGVDVAEPPGAEPASEQAGAAQAAESSGPLPVLTTIPKADPELLDLGMRYWALKDFDDDGRPRWIEKAAELTTPAERPYVVAAATVEAPIPGAGAAAATGLPS